MLTVNPFESLVAARLLEFFDVRTPWHRRLWATGLILTLRETIEASDMVAAKVLYQNSVRALADTAIVLAGTDPGVTSGDPGIGTPAYKKKLHKLLLTDLMTGSIQYLELAQIISDLESRYLRNWSAALQGNAAGTVTLKTERTARAIASHLFDIGFSAEFLFGWFRYAVNSNPVPQSLSEVIADAHTLTENAPKEFEVLVPFREFPANQSGTPQGWVGASEVMDFIRDGGFPTDGIRQMGGMWIKVSARDAWSAVESVAEVIERFSSRVRLATRDRLLPLPDVYIKGSPKRYSLRQKRRRVEVDALYRENQLYSFGKAVSRVDSAIELLSPLDDRTHSTAVAGGWAAIEAILTAPGGDRLQAGYRMAKLVAASFPRAELTSLSYKLQKLGGPLAVSLTACDTNRDRAVAVLSAIRSGQSFPFTNAADIAAIERMREMAADPQGKLNDISEHLSTAFRGFYRNRNIVLHGGKTGAIGLRSSLRNAAPLVGAGMDRIAHAWFVEGLEPVQIAARASVRLATVGASDAPDIVDLLT
ncbi:MAG: hypothetical protein WCG81_10100 [Candidatus Angelobacter sp.]